MSFKALKHSLKLEIFAKLPISSVVLILLILDIVASIREKNILQKYDGQTVRAKQNFETLIIYSKV